MTHEDLYAIKQRNQTKLDLRFSLSFLLYTVKVLNSEKEYWFSAK